MNGGSIFYYSAASERSSSHREPQNIDADVLLNAEGLSQVARPSRHRLPLRHRQSPAKLPALQLEHLQSGRRKFLQPKARRC